MGMNTFKGRRRFAFMVTVLLLLITAGCATGIKYSYDTKTDFSERKTYSWGQSWADSRQDPLVEANVRALADQFLAQKGFTGTSDKHTIMISMSYEFDNISKYSYQLRMLTLNIYKLEPKELVWRGTAYGCIHTDADSSGLKETVQGILSNFPPK
jgi:hypothetical protein